jgi:hypothetical protein
MTRSDFIKCMYLCNMVAEPQEWGFREICGL